MFGWLKNQNEPAKEDALPAPESGAKRWFYLLYTHFSKFIAVNVLFVVFSLPIVTLPASLCGMNRVLIKLWRDGNCFVWTEFIGEFKSSVLRALPLGILSGGLLFASYYCASLCISNSAEILSLAFGTLGALFCLSGLLIGSYGFVLFPMLDLKGSQILRNAACLIMLEGKRDILILCCCAVSAFLCAFAFPVSLAFMLFLHFSLTQFIICALVNEVAQRRIIEPFENAQGASDGEQDDSENS